MCYSVRQPVNAVLSFPRFYELAEATNITSFVENACSVDFTNTGLLQLVFSEESQTQDQLDLDPWTSWLSILFVLRIYKHELWQS